MNYLVNSKEMKQYDKNTWEYFGVPSMVLMERAAIAVVHEITKLHSFNDGSILIVCGVGNNGGDGLAVARLLKLSGYTVEVLFPMDEEKMTKETRLQKDIAEKYHVSIVKSLPSQKFAVIVDALFGIGLSRAITGELRELIDELNEKSALKLAIDIPSGISSDTGEVLGTGFVADITITFGFLKCGMILYKGFEHCGKIVVADIGIGEDSFLSKKPKAAYLVQEDVIHMLPKRHSHSNKGSYGKVLVVAGSKNMAGAAYFSGKGAYLTGCGLVKLYTPEENRNILQTKLPEALLATYPSKNPDLQELKLAMEWSDVIVAGPGLSTSIEAKKILAELLNQTSVPLVLDADALNIIAEDKTMLSYSDTEIVVTPHVGEMARLTSNSINSIHSNIMQTAADFSCKYQIICVLKDAKSVISIPNGMTYINPTGNHGMATGGSGDILSGMIAGLMAQGCLGKDAAPLACYLHGRAGDIAAKEKSSYCMTAEDILNGISSAFLENKNSNKEEGFYENI